MTKNIEICKAEEVGAQVLDILGTTAERQTVAAINAAFGLAIPLPANEPGEITELPAAVSAHDRQLLAQLLGKPEPAATLSTTDPLATFVATLTRDLYRHFAERTADYLPADFPAWFPHDDRNLAHLLQAVQSLAPRKISNGSATNDGLPDGISLARLLAADYSLVTKIHDDTHGWTMDKNLFGNFPNLASLHLNCKTMTVQLGSIATLSSLEMPELELFDVYQGGMLSGEYQGTSADFRKLKTTYSGILYNAPYLTVNPFRDLETITPRYGYQSMCILGNTAIDTIELPNLKTVNASGGCGIIQGGSVRVIKCPALYSCTSNYNGNSTYSAGLIAGSLPNLEELEVGTLTGTGYLTPNSSVVPSTPKLKKVVLGQGTNVSVTLNGWTPSAETIADAEFLPNFKEFIALRLTDQGSGLTLTLSQAVRNAIHAAESTYGIEDIIVNQKHWTLSPAPSA